MYTCAPAAHAGSLWPHTRARVCSPAHVCSPMYTRMCVPPPTHVAPCTHACSLPPGPATSGSRFPNVTEPPGAAASPRVCPLSPRVSPCPHVSRVSVAPHGTRPTSRRPLKIARPGAGLAGAHACARACRGWHGVGGPAHACESVWVWRGSGGITSSPSCILVRESLACPCVYVRVCTCEDIRAQACGCSGELWVLGGALGGSGGVTSSPSPTLVQQGLALCCACTYMCRRVQACGCWRGF